MPLNLLRIISGVQNKSPLPPHSEKFQYKTLISTIVTKNNPETKIKKEPLQMSCNLFHQLV